MRTWTRFCAGLTLTAGLTPSLWAQVAVPPPPPAAAVPAAAPARNLWSFFCLTPEQKEQCRLKLERLCQTPLGRLMNNTMKPASAMSGGVLPTLCPDVRLTDLAKDKEGSPEGTAALIKKSEAEAKARREAIRYLGTVDCRYWPEAKKVLATSLRGDQNECVRWEAALALANGCCCTKETIEALTNALSDRPKDTFPVELSERVRATAYGALHHCLEVYSEPAEEKKGEGPKKEGLKPPMTEDPKSPLGQALEEGRRTLSRFEGTYTGTSARPAEGGLYGIVAGAVSAMTGGDRGTVRSEQSAAPPTPAEPVRSVPQPLPMGPGVAPAVLQQPVQTSRSAAPMTPAVMPVVYANPAPAMSETETARWLTMLRTAANPEERALAADSLSRADARSMAQAVAALTTTASRDGSALVRVVCVRSLVRLNDRSLPVLATLQALTADSDPRVQREAEQALTRMTAPGMR